MAEKTNKLTIGLVKLELTDFAEIVKPETDAITIEAVGTFYKEASAPHPPSWIKDFFGSTFKTDLGLISSSAKAVLLVRVPSVPDNRICAIIFGHGRSLLNEGVLEERFGLKVVLNSVDPDSLRSIDKTALGSIPKQSREQISREGETANFGIDIEQDLVNSVTGKSKIEIFGRTISGRDTFSASAKIDVHNISELLTETIKQYESEVYKERFDWVDQIKDIRSKNKIENLDSALLERLKSGNLEHIWMAPPEILEWADVKCFRYLKKRSQDTPDLDVAELLAAAVGVEITLDWLKNAQIVLISSRSDDEARRWPAYKCIYAEIELGGAMHILNAGKWYQVARDFTAIVDEDFNSIPESTIALPDYTHESETLYNLAAAGSLVGSHCMDADLITHGGGHSRIEFCDILTPDKKLLHIKRYSGSQQMSHLFSQGVVSAELFISDPLFRQKVNDKLPDGHKLADTTSRPNAADYEVVFTIISKSANPLNLPFFSKVSLRNARRRLQAYGFRVSKKKVRAVGNEA
ncbi:TIGR04141 family sporadically distributed protein [Roseibium litorale]|uniref:TIGR04141 family sporadically distributed protein n=1 Tax=Roseibium litorale TaxID=2803841 RepID=A0ABR9CSX1_9HYPH|nr:TIGR04141 family sporadically distributed protein [Roseibium litorale]MBD8893978.1 TIGR04141 family sporadically distributed protein [Roseibium litorale]